MAVAGSVNGCAERRQSRRGQGKVWGGMGHDDANGKSRCGGAREANVIGETEWIRDRTGVLRLRPQFHSRTVSDRKTLSRSSHPHNARTARALYSLVA